MSQDLMRYNPRVESHSFYSEAPVSRYFDHSVSFRWMMTSRRRWTHSRTQPSLWYAGEVSW